MDFINFVSRCQSEQNPQEFKDVLDILCKVDITFEPKIFEYRSPDDFIFYKMLPENYEITFAMKVLCTETHFKITKIYYKSQVDLFNCFYKFRTVVVDNRETDIDKGVNINIMWSPEICNNTIKNFAILTNIMEENQFEYKITKANKKIYYGKDIDFDNKPTTSAFTQPTTSAFTQPTTSAFTQPTTSAFTQPTTSAFTQPTTSAFAQPTTSAFAQPTTSDKNTNSVFSSTFKPSTSFASPFTYGK